MIDLRDVDDDNLGCVFYCDECEVKRKARVEVRWKLKAPGLKRVQKFWARHEHCGEAELDASLDKHFEALIPNYDAKLVFTTACYAEDPEMPFDEIQERYKRHMQDLQETVSG